MNKYSNIVLWLGLIMIVLNLVKHWQDIKSIIFIGSGSGTGSGAISIPGVPFPIPVSQHQKTPSNVKAV